MNRFSVAVAKVIAGDMSLVAAVFYAALTLYLWKRRIPSTQKNAANSAA
ncbi:hypothetical protein [Paenibacillus sp. URB8-2]|nr:hypothetical protein [Paenibacillus sp. URB8-2]